MDLALDLANFPLKVVLCILETNGSWNTIAYKVRDAPFNSIICKFQTCRLSSFNVTLESI